MIPGGGPLIGGPIGGPPRLIGGIPGGIPTTNKKNNYK